MTARKIFWHVRDTLIDWGLVARPRFHMRRHPTGTTRSRLQGRGTRRRFRRLALPQLLRI